MSESGVNSSDKLRNFANFHIGTRSYFNDQKFSLITNNPNRIINMSHERDAVILFKQGMS